MDRLEKGIYDGEAAQRAYGLNKMCYSFNNAENRAAFLADPDAYCAKYGLDAEQRAAIKSRDKKRLIAAGCNQYFLIKFQRVFEAPRNH